MGNFFQPELSFINHQETNDVSPLYVNKIHESIEPKIDNNRIKETDFLSIYDPHKIEEDSLKVEKKEKWFDEHDNPRQKLVKKCADILEYTIFDLLEMDDWMGDFIDINGEPIDPEIASETFLASKYDDLFNGADIIFKSGGTAGSSRSSVFSIDTTFAHSESALNRKIWDKSNFSQDCNLANVEYYQSGNFTGRVKDIPRFIVGSDMPQLLDLARYLYVDRSNLSNNDALKLKTDLRYKVVSQLFVESTAMFQIAKDKYNKQLAEGTVDSVTSNVYDNLAATQSYFSQAHDKMSAQLKTESGKPYTLQQQDAVYSDIVEFYNHISIENALVTRKIGARALKHF
jgi:hypothetical protein